MLWFSVERGSITEIVLPNNGISWGVEGSKVVQLKRQSLIFEVLVWPQSERIEDNVREDFRLTQLNV